MEYYQFSDSVRSRKPRTVICICRNFGPMALNSLLVIFINEHFLRKGISFIIELTICYREMTPDLGRLIAYAFHHRALIGR